MRTVEDLNELTISEALILVANPPSLESRLVPIYGSKLEEAQSIVGRKIASVRAQRDFMIKRIIGSCFKGTKHVGETANNYKELLDIIFQKRILPRDVMRIVEKTESRVATDAHQSRIDVPLTGIVREWRGGGKRDLKQSYLSDPLEVTVYRMQGGTGNPLYLQKKNKTTKRIARKVASKVVLEERKDYPNPTAIRLNDIAAFMFVSRYAGQTDHSETLYARTNSSVRRHVGSMDRVLSFLSSTPLIYKAEFVDYYKRPEVGINGINMDLEPTPESGFRLSPGGEEEKVSLWLKDIYNAMEDEIGRRSHALAKMMHKRGRHKDNFLLTREEQEKMSLYQRRVEEFLSGVPRELPFC